jgi:hypothetical protein
MSERDLLVGGLVQDVLGPRGGPREMLPPDQDPRDEYITGVLAPHTAMSAETDSGSELVGEEDYAGDDQADPGEDVYAPAAGISALPSPTLDPRSRAASIGLSFAIDLSDNTTIDLCCTWARYVRGEGGGWVRNPHGEIRQEVDCSSVCRFAAASDPGVRIDVRSRLQDNRLRVSVFLVNITPCRGDRPTTEEHVFQPQIRVRCCACTRLVPLEEVRSGADEEERVLAFLYRNCQSYARGHLCAAVWRAVDPERPHPSLPSPAFAPFQWADGANLFDAGTVSQFSPADARTELVPVFQISAPDSRWRGPGDAPILDPEQLAELWDAHQLRSALEPLVAGYHNWIDVQQSTIPSLAPEQQSLAQAQLAQCRSIAGRIQAGIDVLTSDDDSRLAFCFANKAIAKQSQWTKGRVNPWWPFQLAFQLLNLSGVQDASHTDREICDLLWFPTGGGKTEAYLGLAAFTLALRRLRAARGGTPLTGGGMAVLSRYTLRLLTIQQFRRALALIAACEVLRIQQHGLVRGWRPRQCTDNTDALWGNGRFAVGLWAGGNVTPNHLHDFSYRDPQGRIVNVYGAITDLEGRGDSEGEPAQVLHCPSCRAMLAIPPEGYQRGETAMLHFVLGDVPSGAPAPSAQQLSRAPFDVSQVTLVRESNPQFATLSLEFTVQDHVGPDQVDSWFNEHVRQQLAGGMWLVPARPARPGYFIRVMNWGRRLTEKPFEFEIYCPNPRCELNQGIHWSEETPGGRWDVLDAFRLADGRSSHCPIPAWTVDEQVYHRCPSMLVATVDKFARLPFDGRAGALFGNVDRYSSPLGFYRTWAAPRGPTTGLPAGPERDPPNTPHVPVERFAPPELVLQDELHLIDGPLGSMVGIYESAIDMLSSVSDGQRQRRPKYIASTATVRRAREQVQAVFVRKLAIFPPTGIEINDSYFARTNPVHPLDASHRGRLYVGVCAPGRGAQTPIVRIWSRLLQHLQDRRTAGAPDVELDPFWTLVGYFNAIRELAGGVSLARQDIPQRIDSMAQQTGTMARPIDEDEPMELSSRAGSLTLPGLLAQLENGLGSSQQAVNLAVATSMFGTGVDVLRLGLMIVHGQPKMTSSYIQATGRVGRASGGLVVTFFRAARPRDLSHYEYFTTYHGSLYRFVEPVTVYPFAPRARDRALGPVSVALLRQASQIAGTVVHERWRLQQRLDRNSGTWACRAHEMATARQNPDVIIIPDQLEQRAQGQPAGRQPTASATASHASSELDRWQQIAAVSAGQLLYYEPTMVNPPSRPVVLGDLAHLVAQTGVVYEDAPNSLREVESTITIRGWR